MPKKISSSTAIILLDTVISTLASVMAILFVRWQIHPISGFEKYVLILAGLVVVISIAAELLSGIHKVIIRHSSFKTIARLFWTVIIKEALLFGTIAFPDKPLENVGQKGMFIASDFALTFLIFIMARVIIVMIYESMASSIELDVKRLGIFVYGTSDKSAAMVTRLEQSEHYNVLGIISTRESDRDKILNDHKVYYASDAEELEKLRISLGVVGILFSSEEDAGKEASGLVPMALKCGMHILSTPKISEIDYGGISQETISEVVDNDFIPDGMSAFERQLKRSVDLVLSFILIIIFSPLILICALAVKLKGGDGPVFYKQERIGRFGRPFHLYKFRTMRVDAEASGPALYSGDNDPRLTKVGRFLRLHHLDELPQLFNVFRGDMAFVGYRPERKFFIEKIMKEDPRYYYLYQIRPGVTSYATLKNGYTDTMEKMLRRLEFDLYYLRHRSAWFDIKVLWQTFMNIAIGKRF